MGHAYLPGFTISLNGSDATQVRKFEIRYPRMEALTTHEAKFAMQDRCKRRTDSDSAHIRAQLTYSLGSGVFRFMIFGLVR